MAAWALSSSFIDVCFLCVCVDPSALSTAVDFSRNYFRRAPSSLLNGYIKDRADFPSFQAQLGCQGFVIFDGAGRIVVPRSATWQERREGAFRDVEGQLRAMLPGSQVPVGRKVRLKGLAATITGREINGERGEVMGASGLDRWLVKVDGSELLAIRPENLEEDCAEEDAKGGDEVVPVASVGHDAMDKDHELCEEALRGLLRALSVPSLRKARSELAGHFEREEALLRDAGFGSAPGGTPASGGMFSALKNHINDHQRIVAIADDALGELRGACDSIEGAVPKAVATGLARAFREHADLYDSLYEGKLA